MFQDLLPTFPFPVSRNRMDNFRFSHGGEAEFAFVVGRACGPRNPLCLDVTGVIPARRCGGLENQNEKSSDAVLSSAAAHEQFPYQTGVMDVARLSPASFSFY